MIVLLLIFSIYFEDSLLIPGGYLNGVAYDGEYAWVTNNTEGVIYKIDGDMNIRDSLRYLPGMNGLAFANGILWVALFNDNTLRGIDPVTGETIYSWNMPGIYSYGVTFDGQYLWHSSKTSMEIQALDPQTGEIIKSFKVPFEPKDLGFSMGDIWAIGTQHQFSFIFILDPLDGDVLKEISFERPYPAGLALNENTMWLSTTAGTGKFYKIDAISVDVIERAKIESLKKRELVIFGDAESFIHYLSKDEVFRIFSIDGAFIGYSKNLFPSRLVPGYFLIINGRKSSPVKKVLILRR